jgi:hypothetical protein
MTDRSVCNHKKCDILLNLSFSSLVPLSPVYRPKSRWCLTQPMFLNSLSMWKAMILPYLSVRSKVTMCLVSSHARRLMHGASINLWENDLRARPNVGSVETYPHSGCEYTTEQLLVLATHWHITMIQVRESVPCTPRFDEWPLDLTNIHYEETGMLRTHRDDNTRPQPQQRFMIPSHFRSLNIFVTLDSISEDSFHEIVSVVTSGSGCSQLRDFRIVTQPHTV